ncbi:hypothetical protein ACHAQA_008098 [Verticillium albo-atrum]
MGKDPLSRIRDQERPHAHSLTTDAKEGKKQRPTSVAAPKARLSDPPAWLASPKKQAGDATGQLKKVDAEIMPKSSAALEASTRTQDTRRRSKTSMAAAESDAHTDAWPKLKPVVKGDKSGHDEHRHSVLWNHVPLRRMTKTDNFAWQAAQRPSTPPFRQHQLRKVTYPESEISEAKRTAAATSVAGPKPDCATCSVPAPSASESPAVNADKRGDPDELFLPYRPVMENSKKPLTVAEVEQALASESSLPLASPPSERGDDMEIYSPIPIMPPNHSCSWRERYLKLTAEVRHLKAEMSSREGRAVDMAAGKQHATQMADVGVEVDVQRDDAGLGVEGLTIVVHMAGKDDLVINTDLRGVGDGQALP